ncbi:TadE/TadG family type IV pilus assembly protein [Selenomonas montiformis]|uniref:TadE/TadG family type IV pilus assembly protein n=1 Tax=Selenomonas montiformis TaxID=2652285 RepID=UPI003F8C68F8
MLLKIEQFVEKVKKKYPKNKAGQSILELCLGFPLVIMMLLFMFDIARIIQAKYETQMLSRNTVRLFAMVGLPKENAHAQKLEKTVQGMIIKMWRDQHPNVSKENIHFSTKRGHLGQSGDISGQLAANEGIFQTFIDTGSTMSAVRDAGKKRIEVRTCVRVGVMSPILRDNNKNKYGRAVCSSYGGYFSSKTNETELRKLLENIQ